MKKRTLITISAAVLFILLPFVLNRANPIIEGYFNELLFDSGGWKLEMHVLTTGTLDGWSLTSRSGQAFFKNGIQLSGLYRVITPESLLSPLTINPLGDSLVIHSPQYPYVGMIYGPGGFIPAPRNGQSMCLRQSGTQFYYLDNTPTLGEPNDAINATGTVQGRIVDTLGHPISGVLVSWGEPFPLVYSDTGGYFSVTEYARRLSLTFSHSGFTTRNLSVQVWPESTIVIGVTLDRIVGVKETEATPSFELRVNYPNPFNPSTMIHFEIPKESYVTLKVYNLLGEEVATLVNEVKKMGGYEVEFNATGFTSGVYFYQINAGNFVSTKKMLILR